MQVPVSMSHQNTLTSISYCRRIPEFESWYLVLEGSFVIPNAGLFPYAFRSCLSLYIGIEVRNEWLRPCEKTVQNMQWFLTG